MVTGSGSSLSVELVELVELVARVMLELAVLLAVMAGDSWAAVSALLASASNNGIRAMRLRAPCVISLFCSRLPQGGCG